MPKNILKYLAPILWAILIFILSNIPGDNYPATAFDFAPLAHFVEFFVLAVLVSRALGLKNKQFYLVLIICGLYALSDEIHQLWVVNRSFSWLDWLIDFLAVLAGMKLYLTIRK
jgi:VanZ family protein